MLQARFHKHRLIFRQPAGTSRGTMLHKDVWYLHIWKKLNPDVTGVGECSPLQGLSFDDRPDYEEKLQWLIGNIHLPEETLRRELARWPSMLFGYEQALQDLRTGGKRVLFPSPFTESGQAIPINGLIWMGAHDVMLRQIDEKIKAGFTVIKLKVGAIDFEEEVNLLYHIRSQFSPAEITIRLDANGAFTREDVFQKLELLAPFAVHSIEQPVKAGQRELMADVCRNSPIPVALDEELIGIFDTEKKAELLERLKPQYIILKPSLLGGFAHSEEWINLARERGVGWWVTSALESNIGLNAIAQWAATLNSSLPQGLGTGSLFTNNIPSPLEVQNGFIHYRPDNAWNLLHTGAEIRPASLSLRLHGTEYKSYQLCRLEDDPRLKQSPYLDEMILFLRQWFNSEPYVEAYTSGSTGTPKRILLSKRAMLASACATGTYLNLDGHGSALLCVSPKFIAGMMMLVRAMLYRLDVFPAVHQANPLKDFTEKANFAAMVPAQVYNALQDPETAERFRNMKTVIIGGGEISPVLEAKLRELPGNIYATYGMTETYSHVAMRKPGSEIFEGMEGVSFETDSRGCLVINAPYLNINRLATNDLIELTGPGEFRWLGRFDNIINRGGIKLIPEVIEKKLHPLIHKRFLITSRPDDKLGNVPVLLIEGATDDEIHLIQEQLVSYLNREEMPVDIISVVKFEETGSGKLSRINLLL